MSNSIFTTSSLDKVIKLVCFKVCGIITKLKIFLVALTIVNETPLIEIDPLSIK